VKTRFVKGVIYHTLDEGETWADFGMEQPTAHFGHVKDWFVHCPRCRHLAGLPGFRVVKVRSL